MNQLSELLERSLPAFIIVPLAGFLASFIWRNRQEKPVARVVRVTKALSILLAITYGVLWCVNGFGTIDQKLVTLYQAPGFVFAVHFYYDALTLVYSIVGAILFFLVCTFSRYYMHRDEGYKRFFNTILLFGLGYNLIIFAGNFETLFIGWEIIGLSSFLLIAFYRERYLPVKNAFKTISNYRISDLALIVAMWMMHHLTHQNITFHQLAAAQETGAQPGYFPMAIVIASMIILAATVKSAQLPFTTWLPRAMEGPTSSSAIFYGSLSVHIGVFLLMRTWPFWENMLWARVLVGVIGVSTAVVATMIARVQPTVKTQIAYSSAAQIGLIFIEVALGWHILALVHFAGNAFLRTYQLLVSPSVLNYLVHHQYFHYTAPLEKPVSRFRAALFVLGLKEWNLDSVMYRFAWHPFKWLGRRLGFLRHGLFMAFIGAAAVILIALAFYKPEAMPVSFAEKPAIWLALSLAVVLFSFAHRGSAFKAWTYLLVAHIFIIGSVAFRPGSILLVEALFYAAGVVAAFVLGLICLRRTYSVDRDVNLDKFHGYVYEQKNTAFLFLVASIGVLGFPVTTAFIGIDVLFTYISGNQVAEIALLVLCFIFIELAALRIFLRVYLGPHKKLYHPVAYRST